MPIRDREWEDFQRDCDFFPAYTDYIFGVDTRPEVTDEPGLHPQIYDPPPLSPPQRLYGLPLAAEYPVAHDVVCSTAQARTYAMSVPQRTSLLKHEPSTDSLLSTPTPVPRALPAPGPPTPLLRPGELLADAIYDFIPKQERVSVNRNIAQAWSIINSDAIPVQKAKAMGYIKSMSRNSAIEREKYFARNDGPVGIQEEEAEQEAEDEAERRKEQLYPRHGSPVYAAGYLHNESQLAEAAAGGTVMGITTDQEYAVHDILQLPAYVQSRLSQLWTCIEIVALQGPPTDPVQFVIHQQAQQYMMAFRQSVPPKGRLWVGFVIDEMIRLRKDGADPLTVLQTMPSVESIYGIG